MNKKLITKIAIDVVMTVLFALLIFPFSTGLAFHEIAGLVILGIFAAHFLLNFQWVKGVTRKFFDPGTPASTRARYILNFAILLNALLVIVTGVLISVALFPDIQLGNRAVLAAVHKVSSYTCGGMLLFHLALHKNYLVGVFKKMAARKNPKSALIPSLSVFAALIFTGLIAWKTFAGGDSLYTELSTEDSGSSIAAVSNLNPGDEDMQIADKTEEVLSLEEYLAEQVCTACPKRCPLSSPRCSRGENQAEEATREYAALYSADV